MMRKYRSRSVTVDVEVDLDQFDTKDLVEELRARECDLPMPFKEELIELHDELRRGNSVNAMTLIERLIWPKWRSRDQCEIEFRQRQNAH